jgi:leucyl aminopeptidase
MQERRRSKQPESLQDRLIKFAKEAREKATRLPPGPDKEEMLRKARRADTASHMEDWLNSTELQPPK